MKSMIVLFALAVAAVASSVSGEGRIVGGSPARPGAFPFVVSLNINNEHFCGGYVYNSKWIVTSARCLKDRVASSILVIAGTVSLSNLNGAQLVFGNQSIVHENYNTNTNENNIALLQLSKDLVLSENVQIISGQSPTLNALGTIAGWGSQEQGGSQSLELLEASVLVRQDDSCSSYGIGYVPTNMICAGDTVHDSCEGDEGSPLLQYDPMAVVGIVSHNRGCGNPSYPTVYTKIGYFSVWLFVHAGPQRS